MQSYRELIVWQKSFKFTLLIYRVTKKFPKEEMYGISNQIRRAAVSMPSNIAEGYARKSRKDYAKFVRIAYGSGEELETQIMLAKELGFLNEHDYVEVGDLLCEVMKMLNRLLEKLE